jgi:hypothetical protein
VEFGQKIAWNYAHPFMRRIHAVLRVKPSTCM